MKGLLIFIYVFFTIQYSFPHNLFLSVKNKEKIPVRGALIRINEKEYITNRNGEVLIKNLSYGRFIVEIFAKGYKTLRDIVWTDKVENHYTFTLIKEFIANINGKVFERDTLKPLTNVKIIIDERSTITNNNGTFNFKHLKPGKIKIRAEKNGYRTILKDIILNKGSNKIKLYLQPKLKIKIVEKIKKFTPKLKTVFSGRVLDIDSNPISNATININGKKIFTDNNGFFRINNISCGEKMVSVLKKGFYSIKRLELLNKKEEFREYILKPLSKLYSINIRIIDEYTQNPLSKVPVCLGEWESKTDAGGNVIFSGLLPGNYLLKIDYPNFVGISRIIKLDNSEKYITIMLKPLKDNTGKIVDIKGTNENSLKDIKKPSLIVYILDKITKKPIKNTVVVLDDIVLRTDSKGRIMAYNIKPKKYEMVVLTDNYEIKRLNINILADKTNNLTILLKHKEK